MQHGAAIHSLLATVNAPRREPIDGDTLLRLIRGGPVEPRWRSHVRALLDEADIGALHDLVLDGEVRFSDLVDTAQSWGLEDAASVPWIREMAGGGVAGSAARDPAGHRRAS